MNHWLNLTDDEVRAWLAAESQPPFRAGQIRKWLHQRRAGSFDEMSDLPKALRQRLAEEFALWSSTIAQQTQAADGTEKLLLELHDAQRIECVLLRAIDGRRTICISTQVGCAMGCVFCASGLEGVARNLTTGEILEQILQLNRLLDADERLSHIVVMGMGEPLANLDNLVPALDTARAPQALDISVRRITVSTVGLPEQLLKLAELDRGYRLAVSLHAPNDELRNQLVPVNKNVGLERILSACDAYFAKTGRRVTYEYVMLGGLNDHLEHAQQLAALLRNREALVNLIPYNPVAGLGYVTPSRAAVAEFASVLETAGVQVKVRHRKGDEIDAACGQLRRRFAQLAR